MTPEGQKVTCFREPSVLNSMNDMKLLAILFLPFLCVVCMHVGSHVCADACQGQGFTLKCVSNLLSTVYTEAGSFTDTQNLLASKIVHGLLYLPLDCWNDKWAFTQALGICIPVFVHMPQMLYPLSHFPSQS